ncbi:MAG: radical SAM protein [Thermoanaerobaculales bacterium]
MRALPRSLILLLSGRCNLSCAYCYQTHDQGRGSMSWETARKAFERVRSFEPGKITVEFTGGEPLLEAVTLCRTVEAIEASTAPGTKVECTVTTNGTLLTDGLLAFLFDHDFTIRISFDGVPATQRQRGEGTFHTLDRLLDRLGKEYPSDFAKRVKILVTVLAATIPKLAESVRYLMGKGVQAIEMGPRFTWDPNWCPSCREELERQVDEVLRLSLEHWRNSGAVPVGFLAGAPLLDAEAPVGEFLCGAPAATALCVDPEGRAWGCPLFASSLQSLTPLALEASRVLDLGPISAPSFSRRLEALQGRAGKLRLFTHRLAKRSSYGACGDCRFVADCQVCPASISHNPHNHDPDLIPEFICAFRFLTLAARERFDEMTGGEVSAAWYREVKVALGRLEAAVKNSLASSERERSLRPARGRRRAAQGDP